MEHTSGQSFISKYSTPLLKVTGELLTYRYFYCMYLQEQYIFAHDAVLESLTCGDTQILPADIRPAIAKLERRDPQTNKTGYESQFKV